MKMAETVKAAASTQAMPYRRLGFTLDTSTGEIIKIESGDSAGQRRELSKTERLELAKESRGAGVEALLERAFEAGVASLLDDEDGKEEESETEEEAGVRQVLLQHLMERTFAARALRREVLRQAIVQTLIRDIVSSGESESETSKAQKSDRAAPKAST
jgi:hypothetical protein